MNPELQKQLFTKFPKLFELFGDKKEVIWCRDGWFNIIYDLCLFIQEAIDNKAPYAGKYEQIQFTCIKEKFSRLTIYYNSRDKDTEDLVDHALDYARHLARHTCERCGSREEIGVTTKGWLQVLCKNCFDITKDADRIDGWKSN